MLYIIYTIYRIYVIYIIYDIQYIYLYIQKLVIQVVSCRILERFTPNELDLNVVEWSK